MFEGEPRVVGNVIISFLRHFAELWHQLASENGGLEVCHLFSDDAGGGELDVGDVISASSHEGRHDQFRDERGGNMRDDRCQGLKRAHPVVEALLLDAVVLSALGDDLFSDVGLAESLSDVT